MTLTASFKKKKNIDSKKKKKENSNDHLDSISALSYHHQNQLSFPPTRIPKTPGETNSNQKARQPHHRHILPHKNPNPNKRH